MLKSDSDLRNRVMDILEDVPGIESLGFTDESVTVNGHTMKCNWRCDGQHDCSGAAVAGSRLPTPTDPASVET